MLDNLQQEANIAFTENGAVSNGTTGSWCLDLFATIGALRREPDEEIILRFFRAYAEDPDLAMKTVFFARDIRGGLGERRVFRIILNWLGKNKPETVRRNLERIPEYGRYDDLLALFGTPCEKDVLELIRRLFEKDMDCLGKGGRVSLLGKWLPSVNASSMETVMKARKIARYMGMSDAAYRKSLTRLRRQIDIIENHLREKDYSFDYSKQPSRAMFKYRKAFLRNDGNRYMNFLEQVESGEAGLHAGNVAPYELVAPYLSDDVYSRGKDAHSFMRDISPEEAAALNATWAAMPDFGGDENALAIIDTSGSMYFESRPLPAAVALSLGLCFAEHNEGIFRDCFIEFSARPQLIMLKGETFADRLRYAASFNTVADTDLEAVFQLILDAAVKNHVSQKELPSRLIIISDMEFNCCVENASETNFQNAKRRFAEAGYKLPEIVFWNVASRNRQQPVSKNEQGVTLVSGTTPRLFDMVAGGNISPYEFMMETLNNPRYSAIAA
ncbi:DUF2828 family protein [Mobilibacterium timonense]|uniref:DUF2828 family protein n=2 Tax=Mobilibacterium timonense TaxID=1871012 RepID=UPI0009850E9B|nr:DUF2828 family protein [Mobilibacterium timonense]